MERLEMLKMACQQAHEQIDASSYLNDAVYAELSKLPEEEAIKKLAKDILEDATFDISH